MDKVSRTNKCVTTRSCKIGWLLFAYDLVWLASSESDLQLVLNSFTDVCDIARIKISISETEVNVFHETLSNLNKLVKSY